MGKRYRATSNFTALRRSGGNLQAILMAFDILELNGQDVRQFPLWHRREVFQGVALFGHEGLRLSEPQPFAAAAGQELSSLSLLPRSLVAARDGRILHGL